MDRVTEDADLDAVLAKELNSLSIQDRNRVQEEIHCVSSLAVDETPELIENSLKQLWKHVKQLLSSRYSNSNNDDDDQTPSFEHDLSRAMENEHSYVHSRDVGLKYLRADLFRVESAAANRMVNHLEMLYKYFGPVALERPLRYSDLSKEEQDCMRAGIQQILPSRDRNGRLVMIMQGSMSMVNDRERLRIVLYTHEVISEDAETQKHGLAIVFAGSEENLEYLPLENAGDLIKIYRNFPERVAVNHQCLPDGPAFQILKGVWMILLAGKEERVRTKFHDNLSNLETHYKMMTYGIPVQLIPRTHTGNIKLKNHLQWIKTRKAIDKLREESSDPTRLECSIIPYPGRHDVLFSRGGNATHSGNLEYTQDMIERLERFKVHPDKESRRVVREEIVACVRARTGRLLHLVKGGWWEELPTEKAHEKITTSFYDLSRRVDAKEMKHQSYSSDTNAFLSNTKRQKVGDGGGGMTCGFFFS